MGREKGVPNKITTDMRAIVLEALEKLGGAEWLAEQADANPSAFMAMLAKMIPFVLPIPDAGRTRFQPLWIGDLTRCVLNTLELDSLIRHTIPLGGPEHFTFEQMVTEILAAAAIRRRLVTIQIPLMQWAIAVSEALLPRSPVPYWWLDLLTVGDATDLVTIPRHFDFEPARFADSLSYLRQKRPWRRDLFRFVIGRL